MPAGAPDKQSEYLAARLRDQISRDGPMPFSDWMAAALYDPEFGYYQRNDLVRWGRTGDYRTAPESSAVFGATLARYFAECYGELGAPPSWTIVEAGAGAGDFAFTCLDALRSNHPAAFHATTYQIDESSNPSRELLKKRLSPFGDKITYGRTYDLTPGSITGVIFSNELLDAFPVMRVTKQADVLGELHVALDQHDDFCWVFAPGTSSELEAYLNQVAVELREGQIVDICPGAPKWWAHAAASLKEGYLITVDYGAEAKDLFSPELRAHGTLRAIADHQLQPDPLASPGRMDLTASVDWTTLRRVGEVQGLETFSFGPLDRFLLSAGALDVLEHLSHNGDPSAVAQLRQSARELVLPGGLASSFQVLVQRTGTVESASW